ncbi:transcription termination factor Rho [Anaeromyxobacter diazotrophicus]|uniref:Transcription termination factor Rho n=1 Tax=Anaeromyxobacter diazotrophicus TaxID=2590199 RepID=A0A7I9VSI7_9BACT|nr:transcription termination factor Rho [Anaeromyxobacter diazotrophicus]GEJ59412.1 transcription termination factor Rho [Anaeromyxobacter diazotrophicus]
MTENEQTPPAGDAPAPAAPVSEQPAAAAAGDGQGGGAPQGAPGQPGQGRRRRRRRGRRGRGAQPGQPGQQGAPNGQAQAPSAAAGPATAGGAPQPQGQPEQTEEVEGVLQFEGKGVGWLRDPKRSYLPQSLDVEVPRWLVERMHLQPGVLVKGVATVRNMKRILSRVDQVEGTDPLAVARRTHFQNLTATDPTEKLLMETRPDEMVGRVLDLIAPIGLGARALITSPPKAGKTIMLQRIAQAITGNRPDVHLMVLLVDERPEELTDMRRNVQGEVIGSSNDRPAEEHIHAAEMAMERARRLVEGGKDVVVLLDSITRLARAYNREIESSGRTLTGGVDSRALERPKRLFGSARKAEEGGSLTIIGTALIDTGSRMDEVIFEEFKGTGNMEVVLSRQLAERRIFPAIDIAASGTRKEEKLFLPKEIEKIRKLRGALASLKPVEAMERLLKKLSEFDSNDEFLASF